MGQDPGSGLEMRLEGASREGIFVEAALDLCDHLCERRAVLPKESRALVVRGRDDHEVLARWVHELLLSFTGEGLLFSRVRVRLSPDGETGLVLQAQLWGEPFDPDRHALKMPRGEATELAGASLEARLEQCGNHWSGHVSTGTGLAADT
jgi:SHS2 domain-containing protein